jgi:hypothetical protein
VGAGSDDSSKGMLIFARILTTGIFSTFSSEKKIQGGVGILLLVRGVD